VGIPFEEQDTPEVVKEVLDVEWKDLGLCEAVWFLKVEKLGPLIVSQINGKSLY
jgi:tartrate dehydratase beta subunit/fumarate hydratase class I family protein